MALPSSQSTHPGLSVLVSHSVLGFFVAFGILLVVFMYAIDVLNSIYNKYDDVNSCLSHHTSVFESLDLQPSLGHFNPLDLQCLPQ